MALPFIFENMKFYFHYEDYTVILRLESPQETILDAVNRLLETLKEKYDVDLSTYELEGVCEGRILDYNQKVGSLDNCSDVFIRKKSEPKGIHEDDSIPPLEPDLKDKYSDMKLPKRNVVLM